MDFPYFHSIVNYIHDHPHVGGLITFLVAFAESLAIVGAIIPGSVTMTAIGMLIGASIMPATSTLIWAVTGAFCGDFLSYWVGFRYNERLKTLWPFRNYPQWLEQGKSFFHRHGGKSVVIGRFVGPARSAVPLIAGLMRMTVGRFVCAALPSAALWSLVYITPGIVVGMMSLELPPATATKFILSILAIVACSWIFFVLVHLFFKTVARVIDRSALWLWQYLDTHRSLHWTTTALSRPDHPNPHRQLLLLSASLICTALFVWIAISVMAHTGLTHWNQPLFALLRSLRSHHADNIMIMVTFLGNKWVLLSAALVILAWLLWRRTIWAACHWLAILVLSAGLGEVIKHVYYSPRPSGLLHGQVSSSFPSGHVLLSTALLGFLAVLIGEYLTNSWRKLPYVLASIAIVAVALSRLYLGAHWLTDVLGALTLGLALLSVAILSYHRRVSRPVAAGPLSLVAVIALVCVWGVYTVGHFRSAQDDYTLYWPTVTLDTETWWTNHTHEIPLFVASRLGKPSQVINVQWLGSLSEIQSNLLAQGWQPHTLNMSFKSTLNRLSPKTNPQHLPLLPTLYQNQAPVLFLTKTDAQQRQLNLILWRSNATLADNTNPLWLGSVHYYLPHRTTSDPKQQQQLYMQAVRELITSLQDYRWKTMIVSEEQQPPVMAGLHWDGVLLLVRGAR